MQTVAATTSAAAVFAAATVGGAHAAGNVSAACQSVLDGWCNYDTACVHLNQEKGYALPLFARDDRGHAGETDPAWRCYSPSSLSPDRAHYTNGSAYCTRPELADVLAECAAGGSVGVNASVVFSQGEVAMCSFIRTPQPAVLANGTIVLFAQCRVAPGTSAPEAGGKGPSHRSSPTSPGELGDDFRRTRMVMKASSDDGVTWGPMRFVAEMSTGVGVAVVDRGRDALVFQYQSLPNADPYENNTVWQKISLDGGATWTEPVDLTPQLAACNAGITEMVCGAAGSRIQTESGRLVFAGHNTDTVCVWYSDDGGKTYHTSQPFTGNEVSVAQLADGSLYMNGRQGAHWAGHRTGWHSADEGASWSAGQAVPDLVDVNCEAALVAVPPSRGGGGAAGGGNSTLLLSEPRGPGRANLALHCSCDDGTTWASSLVVNPGAPAQYSALVPLDHGRLLAIWEDHPTQRATIVDTSWCACQQQQQQKEEEEEEEEQDEELSW